MHPDATEGAVQFNAVPVLVVEDANKPVGAAGTVWHALAGVVTFTSALCAEEPAESEAATVKLNIPLAVRPLTGKFVLVVVPSDVPFSKTVYPVTLQLLGGVTAVQLSVASVEVTLLAASPEGALGTAVQVAPPPPPWQGPTRDQRAGTFGGCQFGAADTSG